VYRLLIGKPEGKRPLGRPRSRWVDNITMDLVEVGWSGVEQIDLAQDREKWGALEFHRLLGKYRVAAQIVGPCVVLSPAE
jgi:hypothetical protein